MNWSGPYVGINGGYGGGKASTSFDSDGDADGLFASGTGSVGELSPGDYDQALVGAVYGVHAGYNVQVWRDFFAGFEGVYDQTTIRAKVFDALPSMNFVGSDTSATLQVKSLLSVTPQVGLAWNRTMFRAKGGLTAGRVESQLTNSVSNGSLVGSSGPTIFDQDQTRVGWTWGLGADYALTDHWIGGLAFDYYDLGVIHYGGVTTPDTNWPLGYEVHPILRVATARLSYKFGGPDSSPRRWEPEPEASKAPSGPAIEERTDRVGALIASLKSDDGKVRAEAAVQLGELRSNDGVEPLIAALSDKLTGVRGSAADALGKIGNHRAVAPLLLMLEDPKYKVRALAARALGTLGDYQALPSLKNAAAHDSDGTVRKMAGAAVNLLTQPGAAADESDRGK